MFTDKEVNVGLRIFSKTLTCTEISSILDWQPSEQFEKGTPIYKRNPERLREEYLWVYNLELEQRILFEEQLQVLVDMICQRKGKFRKILSECQIDMFCGYSTKNGQGGFTLEAKLMQKLVSLNIDFSINFYSI